MHNVCDAFAFIALGNKNSIGTCRLVEVGAFDTRDDSNIFECTHIIQNNK